ncbi:MAG: Fe-S-containing protein, partial [Deferrisomatales bacterium]|nr:Fe-S-containing protein [Deferrisomatales bacterium]
MSDRNDKNAAKKAAVLGGKKKSPVPFLLMTACAVLVIGGGVLFMGQNQDPAPSIAQAFQPAAVQAAELTYPLAEFADGTARFFGHQTADGVQVRFFVLKSSDGVIRSAFDACDACWAAGKGYRQDGDEMVCQNCR